MILSFEQVGEMMDEIADTFPQEFYKELNGAVLLIREEKHNPTAPELLILGTYCRDYLGRYIELYYGSFAAMAAGENWSERKWHKQLRDTLAHEFTHHLESLAGERALEIKDAEFMANYWAEREQE